MPPARSSWLHCCLFHPHQSYSGFSRYSSSELHLKSNPQASHFLSASGLVSWFRGPRTGGMVRPQDRCNPEVQEWEVVNASWDTSLTNEVNSWWIHASLFFPSDISFSFQTVLRDQKIEGLRKWLIWSCILAMALLPSLLYNSCPSLLILALTLANKVFIGDKGPTLRHVGTKCGPRKQSSGWNFGTWLPTSHMTTSIPLLVRSVCVGGKEVMFLLLETSKSYTDILIIMIYITFGSKWDKNQR